MKITDYNNVGKLHRTKIAELKDAIRDLKVKEKAEKYNLVQTVIDELNPSLVTIKNEDGRICIYKGDSRWSNSDVYIGDNFNNFGEKKTYSVRHSIQSNSGYSDKEQDEQDFNAHVEIVNLIASAKRGLALLIDDFAAIEAEYEADRNVLYTEKRQFNFELDTLIELAKTANEKIYLNLLTEGFSFINADGGKTRVYTGYGDDYENLGNVKLLKNSVKSVLLENENIWMDGTSHPQEFRYKKEDLFEDMHCMLLKAQKEAATV